MTDRTPQPPEQPRTASGKALHDWWHQIGLLMLDAATEHEHPFGCQFLPLVLAIEADARLVPEAEALPMGERDCMAVIAWWQAQAVEQGARAERAEAAAPDPVASPPEAVRLLAAVLDQFDYWTGEPRPAIDGGTVRLHNFREVQPPMEKVLAEARRFLEGAVASPAPLDALTDALWHVMADLDSTPGPPHVSGSYWRDRAAAILARLEGQPVAEEPEG